MLSNTSVLVKRLWLNSAFYIMYIDPRETAQNLNNARGVMRESENMIYN